MIPHVLHHRSCIEGVVGRLWCSGRGTSSSDIGTIVASSLLESGGGVESKTMARHVRWWALLGLVGALDRGAVVVSWLVFWLVAASA